ncbi:MAG: hypothetical protein U0002_17570 [Thermoanaerobaculia bacterium]
MGRRQASKRAGAAAPLAPQSSGEPASRGLLGRLSLDWAGWPWVIAAWTVLVQAVGLLGNPLARTPVGVFFFGDSAIFLEAGRRLASGLPPLADGLPLHPPLPAWLTMPLWWTGWQPATVFLAAKILASLLAGVSLALFYRLVKPRVPAGVAEAACLLAPLGFGELALASGWSAELPYRLLLLLILTLGWRWPVLAGALESLAVLARSEHLGLGVLVALAVALGWRERRRALAWMLAGAALVLVPYTLAVHARLAAYNEMHAAELPRPLPSWRALTFAGPLNFALAQREEGIFFSRRSLPPPSGEPAALVPTFAPHNEALVDGYRLGWRAIAESPGRFLARTLERLEYSASALALGWTWRDLPNAGSWLRQPADLGRASNAWWAWPTLALVAFGAWRLRQERALLLVGLGLVLYRLAINAVFFPHLRSMLVVGPWWVLLAVAGLAGLAGRRFVPLAALTVAGLGLFQLATAAGMHPYELSGERDESGALIDDRPVSIDLP